jgi:hypothetical protein
MMELSITNNINSIQRGLSNTAKRQVPFAIASTLTKLAFEAMQEEKQQAPKHLDRPTPYTLKGFRYKKANKRNLMALVYIDRASSNRAYMKYAIDGGTSKPNKAALVHPSKNSKLNKYGNLPRNYVKKALANKAKFFSGVPKGMNGDDSAGIWQRYGPKRNQRIRMVAQWRKSRVYQAKFPFYEITGGVVAGRANAIFNKQLAYAMATAR